MQVVLATANPDKADEIRAIVGPSVAFVPRPSTVPEVVEDGATLLDNARLKARALVDATGLAALADDTGLEVDALHGAPGVHTARYAGDNATYRDNVDKMLDALRGVPDAARTARFRTVVVVAYPDGREVIGEGVVEGRIADRARGSNGFGYDPVFIPDEGDGRTFAELPAGDKHAISHRGRALRSIAARLTPPNER